MEYLVEAILDLILEGSIEISKNKKISKWIRYPLIVIICLFFAILLFGTLVLGIISLDENFYLGMFLIIASLVMIVGCFYKFRKEYLERKDNTNEEN